MADVRIVSVFDHMKARPTTCTLADALAKAGEIKELDEWTSIKFSSGRWPNARSPYSLGLQLTSPKDDDVLLVLPTSTGCRAICEDNTKLPLSLDSLDGADVGINGQVTLRDGVRLRGVEFDVLPLTYRLPEKEQAIIFLTIKFLGAENQCFRGEYGLPWDPDRGILWGIDFGTLSGLEVRSVKELTCAINQRIGSLPRGDGQPPFSEVTPATVQRVLDMASIRKVRGRPRKAT